MRSKEGRKQSVKDNRLKTSSHYSSLEKWFMNPMYSVFGKNVMPIRKPNDCSIFKKVYGVLLKIKSMQRGKKKLYLPKKT